MTSSMHQGMGQTTEGRSVRDIVENEPGLVNEGWCRKIFRQLLQSLERQYAMDMPHRAITADTVVFHENGEPLLLPSIVSDPAPEQADDLSALARLVHYAITRELVPAGPLQGRGLAGYSDALLNAVDRCMDPDPDLRPHSIDALRALLGVLPPGSLPAAPRSLPPEMVSDMLPDMAPGMLPAGTPKAAAEFAPDLATDLVPEFAPDLAPDLAPDVVPAATPDLRPSSAAPLPIPPLRASADTTAKAAPPGGPSHPARPPRGLNRPQRWAVAAGGGAILLAIVLVGVAELRDSGSFDNRVLTLPQDGAARPQSADATAPAAPPAGPAAPDAAAPSIPPTSDPTMPPPSVAAGPARSGTTPPAAPAMPATTLPEAAPPRAATAATAATTAATATAPPATAASIPGTPNTGSASYKLQIQPWGTVYVDGVDRGVSPPVKRLVLAPGRHTVRVTNPNFHERTLEVDTVQGDGRIAIDFGAAE